MRHRGLESDKIEFVGGLLLLVILLILGVWISSNIDRIEDKLDASAVQAESKQ